MGNAPRRDTLPLPPTRTHADHSVHNLAPAHEHQAFHHVTNHPEPHSKDPWVPLDSFADKSLSPRVQAIQAIVRHFWSQGLYILGKVAHQHGYEEGIDRFALEGTLQRQLGHYTALITFTRLFEESPTLHHAMIVLNHAADNSSGGAQSIYSLCNVAYASKSGCLSRLEGVEDIDHHVQMTIGDDLDFTYREGIFGIKFDSGISKEMQTVLQARARSQLPKSIADKFNGLVGTALQEKITRGRHEIVKRIIKAGQCIQKQRAEQLLAECRLKGVPLDDTVESLQRRVNSKSVLPVAYDVH